MLYPTRGDVNDPAPDLARRVRRAELWVMHGATPTVRRRPRRAPAFAAVCAIGLVAAGCDSAPHVSARDAYVPAPATAGTASAYLTLRNSGRAVHLVSVSSPDAGSVQIHRTRIDATGRATMTPLRQVDLPTDQAVTLGPGGIHLMLLEPRSLKVGDVVRLRLKFDGGAADLDVKADVVDEIPEGSS
jgi:copper(I)-binding protein